MAPERKFAVIIVANRSGSGMPKLADAISEAMLPLDPKDGADPATHPLDAAIAPKYAGVYVNGTAEIVLEASRQLGESESQRNSGRDSRAPATAFWSAVSQHATGARARFQRPDRIRLRRRPGVSPCGLTSRRLPRLTRVLAD